MNIGEKCRAVHQAEYAAAFLRRASLVHGDRYSYKLVKYINSGTNVEIVCQEHGPFWQMPETHIRGRGCPKCGKVITKATIAARVERERADMAASFLNQAVARHGNRFDYSKVIYINSYTKVIIGCSVHGDFEQTPSCHLIMAGCARCSHNKAPGWYTEAKFAACPALSHSNGRLYVVTVKTADQCFAKVGITKWTARRRLRHIKATIQEVHGVSGPLGTLYQLEQAIKSKLVSWQYIPPRSLLKHGATECFNMEALASICELVDEVAK